MNEALEPIPPRSFAQIRKRYERRRRSHWAGHRGFESPRLLPWRHGDAKQPVALSFYAAPECVIIVLVDSALPLDLPLDQRCSESPPPSFRAVLDEIYDKAEDTWSDPPASRYRLGELRREMKLEYPDPDDAPPMWSHVLNSGSTWASF